MPEHIVFDADQKEVTDFQLHVLRHSFWPLSEDVKT